jgi:hypothetical protein
LHVSNCLNYKDLIIRHILYGHPAVLLWLTELFNAIISRGYVPDGFGNNVIIPVIKNRCVGVDTVSNCRPVSIEPVYTKLFEKCLFTFIEPFLHSHSNQYGFVSNGGCNKALFTFRSTVQFFFDGDSRVYVASLDLCKAFDRVNHFGLLLCLLKHGLPLCLINVLYSWFSKLSGKVSWNNKFSDVFHIRSGVPEGSINRPLFFN